MTDVEVLAENTAQVAAGEEYGTGASAADKDAFLAEMGANGTDYRSLADSAEANLAFAATDFTLTRTQPTGIHAIP